MFLAKRVTVYNRVPVFQSPRLTSAAHPLSDGSKQLVSRELKYDVPTIVTIHESCNATERRQLTKALRETYELATVARDYVLKNGHDDKLFKTYFGTAQPYPVLGANEQLISGNKTGILFRCDNIDGKCKGGTDTGVARMLLWRPSFAPLSYEGRKPLEQFCALGYTVTNSSPSYYFAADLMHRFYHIPTIGNGIIGHYADSYEECLQLAIDHPENATYNTHSLQYFAADVYARVIGNPGEGCTGNFTLHLNTMGSTSTGDSKTYSGETTHNDKTTSNSNGQHCHTHANGEVHCD
uniref:Putative peptidase domain-containing protein n=1 Tax=Moniliophthora roreri TaxID=221103 RepID=A0A0W0FSV3_MONRR